VICNDVKLVICGSDLCSLKVGVACGDLVIHDEAYPGSKIAIRLDDKFVLAGI
jgi:hypothetical protein